MSYRTGGNTRQFIIAHRGNGLDDHQKGNDLSGFAELGYSRSSSGLHHGDGLPIKRPGFMI